MSTVFYRCSLYVGGLRLEGGVFIIVVAGCMVYYYLLTPPACERYFTESLYLEFCEVLNPHQSKLII